MFDKFKKEKKPDRFIVKEKQETILGFYMNIIVDSVTGVNYLCSGEIDGTVSAITPLLDRNGNVVIDDTANCGQTA